jgi:hypothetical protein
MNSTTSNASRRKDTLWWGNGYNAPGLKTTEGIADVGFARVAWSADPGGDVLSIVGYRS